MAFRERRSDNDKRRLMARPDTSGLIMAAHAVRYAGSGKHKLNPVIFGLEPYRGPDGDRTLCDRDAGFGPADMTAIPALLLRGAKAGLVAPGCRIWWSVADNGWIFEARITNIDQNEYHGYPLLPSEAIAGQVYRRFADWAAEHGADADRQAAQNCKVLYGFRS
jgi:hypothetical protein